MAIAYKSAGAGVATETSGGALSPANPATVDAGDILILFLAYEGTTTAPSPPGSWTLLAGPHNVGTASVARVWMYGKIADGTEDGATNACGTPAVTTQRAARIYSFSGRVSGTITELVTAFSTVLAGDSDPTGPTVTTTVAGALACALVYQHDNNTLETFAGSSDTWTERGTVGGYIFALTPGGVLDLLTATPAADPGTVSGGAMTVVNDPWVVLGFQISPSPEVLVPTPKAATDSCRIAASSEEPTFLKTIAVADSCAVVLTETARKSSNNIPLIIGSDLASVTQVGIFASDSCAIQATEASAPPSVAAAGSDSCTVQASEAVAITIALTVVDSCAVVATETSSIASAVVASESCALQCSEIASIASTVSAVDSCAIQASEAARVDSVGSAEDSLAVIAVDALLANASETEGDSSALGLSDSASIAVILATTDDCAVQADEVGSQALVSPGLTVGIPLIIGAELATIVPNTPVDDTAAVVATEAVTLSAVLAASDTAAIGASESVVILGLLSVAEQASLGNGTEAVGIAVTPATHLDSLAVVAEELASIAVVLAVQDSTVLGLSEQASVVVVATATETAAVPADEAALIAVMQSATESAAVAADETVARALALTTSDEVSVTAIDVAFVETGESFPVTASESVAVIADEVAAIATDFVELSVSDAAELLLTEAVSIIDLGEVFPISATDDVAVVLEDRARLPLFPAEDVALLLLEEVSIERTTPLPVWGGGNAWEAPSSVSPTSWRVGPKALDQSRGDVW